MNAYCLFDNLEVHDSAALAEYARRVAPIVQAHGGRYVTLGGRVELLEGSWSPTFPVLIEFPSIDAARGWYDSDEYRELKELRMRATRSNGVLFGGDTPAEPGQTPSTRRPEP